MRPSAGEHRRITSAAIDPGQRQVVDHFDYWTKFRSGPRRSGVPLLQKLGRYPDCVLVAGCQRSGTTMLTRLIANSDHFWRLALTRDDELDAALILCGELEVPNDQGRYCFQTTYLNASYPEYRSIGPGQRLIWVLRNPLSVVYSMVHNWRRWALNELYEDCGLELAASGRMRRFQYPWPLGPSRIEKACLSYAAKTAQIKSIRELIPPHQLMVVDYDQLVTDLGSWLPRIFAFLDEPYRSEYAGVVRANSLKKAQGLSEASRELVHRHAMPVYEDCLRLVSSQRN